MVVNAGTSGQTIEVRTFNDTFVGEVGARYIVLHAIGTAGDRQRVFLTEAVDEGFVFPIIGLPVVAAIGVTHGSVRVELTGEVEGLLAGGDSPSLVTVTVPDVLVYVSVSQSVVFAVDTGAGVGHSHVSLFHEHAGVVDYIVHGHGAGVDTPASVHVDAGFTLLTGAGGDEHNTVSTASTVQSGGGSVLEHNHRFDVGGRDIADGALVGHTVYYIQRRGRGVDRACTANLDGGSGAGSAIRAEGLHTGHVTAKGLGNVRHECIFELF